jgi:predicted RNA-binding protein with PUA-like domain
VNHWLFKSEPDAFGVDDLKRCRKQSTTWQGVRNYQVRNLLRDSIKQGDIAFFYHSSCALPGIAGLMEVISAGYPDASAFEAKNEYYDAASDPAAPRWYCVDVKLIRKTRRLIGLDVLRGYASNALRDFILLRKGNRMSITPVTKQEWDFILSLE